MRKILEILNNKTKDMNDDIDVEKAVRQITDGISDNYETYIDLLEKIKWVSINDFDNFRVIMKYHPKVEKVDKKRLFSLYSALKPMEISHSAIMGTDSFIEINFYNNNCYVENMFLQLLVFKDKSKNEAYYYDFYTHLLKKRIKVIQEIF